MFYAGTSEVSLGPSGSSTTSMLSTGTTTKSSISSGISGTVAGVTSSTGTQMTSE
jgi:hypothetical protein